MILRPKARFKGGELLCQEESASGSIINVGLAASCQQSVPINLALSGSNGLQFQGITGEMEAVRRLLRALRAPAGRSGAW